MKKDTVYILIVVVILLTLTALSIFYLITQLVRPDIDNIPSPVLIERTPSEFPQGVRTINVCDSLNLLGDYSNSMPEDFLINPPNYIVTAKMLYSPSYIAVVVMEYNISLLWFGLNQSFANCGLNVSSDTLVPENTSPTQRKYLRDCLVNEFAKLGLPTNVINQTGDAN